MQDGENQARVSHKSCDQSEDRKRNFAGSREPAAPERHLKRCRSAEAAVGEPRLQTLIIDDISTNSLRRFFVPEARRFQTVLDLKAHISERVRLPVVGQRLLFDGVELRDDSLLTREQIQGDLPIQVARKILGC
eukprot:SAG11_NODE_275_length_11309_cov_6.090901_3_plen_134_part_00